MHTCRSAHSGDSTQPSEARGLRQSSQEKQSMKVDPRKIMAVPEYIRGVWKWQTHFKKCFLSWNVESTSYRSKSLIPCVSTESLLHFCYIAFLLCTSNLLNFKIILASWGQLERLAVLLAHTEPTTTVLERPCWCKEFYFNNQDRCPTSWMKDHPERLYAWGCHLHVLDIQNHTHR